MSVETRNRSRPVGVDEPVDGLDGAAGLAPTQALRAIYAFFYNKKVGLTLILAAGLACLFGVLFPQMPAGVRGDPASVDGWLQSVRPSYGGWTSIMDAVGLFNVFSSPLFLTIMGLLALSITSIPALLRRMGPAWQKLHRWVYLAVALAVVHFVMVAKVWETDSLVYGGLVLGLLGYRAAMRIQGSRGSRRRASTPVPAPAHQ